MDAITSSRRGFTLIELMTVVMIMAVMMGIAVAAWIDWSRGAGMRSSLLDAQASLALTRQWAITHRMRTTYVCGNTNVDGSEMMRRGYYQICTNNSKGQRVPVGNPSFFAENIVVTNYVDEDGEQPYFSNIVFKIDGTCGGSVGIKRPQFDLIELNRATPLRAHVEVYPLTGRSKAEPVISSDEGGGPGGGGGGGER